MKRYISIILGLVSLILVIWIYASAIQVHHQLIDDQKSEPVEAVVTTSNNRIIPSFLALVGLTIGILIKDRSPVNKIGIALCLIVLVVSIYPIWVYFV